MNDDLIVIGFGGLAGAGKTATANLIAPGHYMRYLDDNQKPYPIVWTKLSFAMPIKKIVSILQQTQGENAFSRRSYQIHDALRELIGHAVEYDELVDMVYEVCSHDLPRSGKPREFLQWIGTDFLRQKDDDVFIKWMRRQINYELGLFHKEVQDYHTEDQQKLGVVIDDMRFENEITLVKGYPRNLVVRLDVDPREAQRRLEARDGHAMDPRQLNHSSERVMSFDPSVFDAILDTTEFTERQVADAVLSHLNQRVTMPRQQTLEYNASELVPKYA
jgi:hypothetical protein